MSALESLPALNSGARLMLGDEIYTVLRDSIMDGTIAPDSRINAGELARRFDVSPTPVREALARLESDRLVEKHPLKGYRTTELLDDHEVAELFELRLLLEPESAGHAALRRTDDDIILLRAEIELGRAARNDESVLRLLAQHDVRIHDGVFRAAKNETVRQAYSRTHCHLHTFRLSASRSYFADTVEEHAVVVEAIAARDAAGAKEAMRAHIEYSRERLLRE